MRVLFDTNVLLDALLGREPFVADAAFLLERLNRGKSKGLCRQQLLRMCII